MRKGMLPQTVLQQISRRNLLAGGAAAGVAVSGLPRFAFGQDSTGATPQRGGTLVMLVDPEPPTLASYLSTSGPVGQVTSKVFDGLLEYNFELEPIPSLANSWEISDDGKTITFHLRDDVTFHDGEPFTSADVQFTIMDVLRNYHPRGVNTFSEVSAVEAPDKHTVVFSMAHPAPYMMMALSGYESPMLPKHIYGKGDILTHENANKPVGTGPFKFVEWSRGQYVRLDRNDSFWKEGQPYLDRVVARFIPDPSTSAAAMENGEAHIAGFGAIPYNDMDRLGALPHLEATTDGYAMQAPIVQLDFNTRKPPFDDVRVRRAVSFAIDPQFVIDNVWFGFGKPATGPISSNFDVVGIYTDDVRAYHDEEGPEIAKGILDAAGYAVGEDGWRFEIVHDVTPYGEEWQRCGQYVKQALEEIGIKVTLRYEDVATWLKRLYTDYDFQLSSNWIQGLADPVIGVHRLYHSNSIRQGTVFVNESRWWSPQTDELMDMAKIETDQMKRNELYHRFQKLVTDAAPYEWIFELHFVTVYNTNFKDLIVSPLGLYSSFSAAYKAEG